MQGIALCNWTSLSQQQLQSNISSLVNDQLPETYPFVERKEMWDHEDGYGDLRVVDGKWVCFMNLSPHLRTRVAVQIRSVLDEHGIKVLGGSK